MFYLIFFFGLVAYHEVYVTSYGYRLSQFKLKIENLIFLFRELKSQRDAWENLLLGNFIFFIYLFFFLVAKHYFI